MLEQKAIVAVISTKIPVQIPVLMSVCHIVSHGYGDAKSSLTFLQRGPESRVFMFLYQNRLSS